MSSQNTVTKPMPGETQPATTTRPKRKRQTFRFKEFRKRMFLNLPDRESDAFVSVHVKNDKWDGYSIRITDCNEKITLHGGLHKVKSRKNALHKIDTLTEALTELREHLVSEFKRNNLKY